MGTGELHQRVRLVGTGGFPGKFELESPPILVNNITTLPSEVLAGVRDPDLAGFLGGCRSRLPFQGLRSVTFSCSRRVSDPAETNVGPLATSYPP